MALKHKNMTVDELRNAIEKGESHFDYICLPDGSDMSWVNLKIIGRKLTFNFSVMRETNWNNAVLSFISENDDRVGIEFICADLSKSCFENADLRKAKLRISNFEEANLKKAKLQEAEMYFIILKRASLIESNLDGANLIDADLEEAKLDWVNMEGTKLMWANFLNASLHFSNFKRANMTNTNLEGASIRRSFLHDADIRRANIKKTDFYRSKFIGSDLSRIVNIESAIFTKAFLNGATFNYVPVELYRIWHYKKLGIILRFLFWLLLALFPHVILWLWWHVGQKKWEKPNYPRFFIGVVDFSEVAGLDQIVCTDAILKRDLVDMQYIQQFEKKHPFVSFLWWISSECGRNLSLWIVWSVIIALSFGFVYSKNPESYKISGMNERIVLKSIGRDNNVVLGVIENETTAINGKQTSSRVVSDFTPYYFSIVTFTTLGFGDVTPLNESAERWLAAEVIMGYVMLGGLISLLANKLARRS